MIGRIEQQREIVLSLHFDDGHAEFAQEGGGDRPIIGVGSAAAFRRDHTSEDHFVRSGETLAPEQVLRRMYRWNLENGRNIRLLGSRADQAG